MLGDIFGATVDLTGCAALVTGGSGDLGRAIALALAEAGADVAVTWVGHREGAVETSREVERRGRRAAMLRLDQADPAAIGPAVEEAVAALGRLDVLVNNAGWNTGIPFRDLEALTDEIWDHINDINLRGPFLLARAAARHLRARGTGRIVNVASVAGLKSHPYAAAYCASKGGVVAMTRAIAVEYILRGVRVNCVCPGAVETAILSQFMPPADADPKAIKRLMPVGRYAKPEELASTIVFLASDDASYVNGAIVVVDGGMIA